MGSHERWPRHISRITSRSWHHVSMSYLCRQSHLQDSFWPRQLFLVWSLFLLHGNILHGCCIHHSCTRRLLTKPLLSSTSLKQTRCKQPFCEPRCAIELRGSW